MSLRPFSEFVIATGLLTGKQVGTNADDDRAGGQLEEHTSPGCDWVEGAGNRACQRVEIVDGVRTLVAIEPTLPADSEWQTWRWDVELQRAVATPTLKLQKVQAGDPLKAELDAIDARIVRPATEITAAQLAGEEPQAEDVARLTELRGQKSALRVKLAAVNAATTQAELDDALAS